MNETVLIVDDEDSVRKTFHDWLTGVANIRVFSAADAEAALLIANEHVIDLAVLDWNLGSGSDGLRLLEDLVDFQPEIVAILVTGFANQATPLDALRMGVRDYLDKNQSLDRSSFLAAIRKQLDRIAPMKRQRELNRSLGEFRDAVDKVLPLVQASATLNDPVPLPSAIHALFRFLLHSTGAVDGALLVRHIGSDGAESTAAYGATGESLPITPVPFRETLAASVVSLQDPCIMNDFDAKSVGAVSLMPFEQNRRSILATPLRVGTGTHVVLELFDKASFTEADRKLVAAAAEIGSELLRQALAEKQTHRLLFDAVAAALEATDQVSATLQPTPQEVPPANVMEKLKRAMADDVNAVTDAETGLKLVEAVRNLAVRHGSPAVHHCIHVIESLRRLLDQTQG